MSKEKVIVICPGRGVYNKTELNYLNRYHSDKKEWIQKLDQFRQLSGQEAISELDSMDKFKPSVHTKGENAASLIYACSYLDYLSINPNKYEVVAITGNSMGWYLALACARALDDAGSFHLINTMGSMLKEGLIGGQIIYPIVDSEWKKDSQIEKKVKTLIELVNQQNDCAAYVSIEFGGYLVIGGNDMGLRVLMEKLEPVDERFPMKLAGNGAFHTPLFNEVSIKAKTLIGKDLFLNPRFPLIDGRGQIWHPKMTEQDKLYDYTLFHQVTKTYDFTRAITVALKEYAPDRLILTGPGTTMGGAIAQILIENKWLSITNKSEFSQLQKDNPFLLSMGHEEQRRLVTN